MKDWYYSLNGEQVGPVSAEELQSKFATGVIAGDALVWAEGMGDWVAYSSVPELNQPVPSSFSGSAAPPVAGAVSPYQAPQAGGAPMGGQLNPGEKIPTYLWQSIAATLLCCLPFGVVGIVYAAKVDNLIALGRVDEARAASNSAKTWVNVSVIVGLVIGLLSFVGGLAGG